ncbi:MAG: hypothetical protein COS82_07890 [Zetaproteobacteria bacterium CG06_land_8_20_14_3_00_59_53]|nr:MAG: hypothetical protein COX56_03065 [Zetaproteobacteria bacterium CG23_combo_of_CG06-09_8_20_14_all_59_86]PIQ65076.1 MAG: hypothetical protein COV97_05720 [Zetaproteobacteria bacterium CG11_big_fil_rev_8_21_14_0_20_59_439]PIU70171.1 MAG: hypothetical protein COS82_07890 [Zetaproteobacteria bacterium CG06_land_8_20_14_3_00_59_53]PIU96142.1 MAG: hypothetical protein COS62_10515 [Zetaproteobacteria bacterium CG03_land_8_20_14_0_80_59_51]PIY44930.1 MAG: hypothetical protein COZ02_11205 [Zetapr
MEENMPLRVLVISSNLIWRSGLDQLIREVFPDSNVLVCASRRECLNGLSEFKPELITIRCSNKGLSCLELVQRISAMQSRSRILIIGEGMDVVTAGKLRDAGALGLLSMVEDITQLREAMQAVARGRPYTDSGMAILLAESSCHSRTPFAPLTQREYQVLGLILEGKPTEQIAGLLNMSGKTAANHHCAILRKLGIPNNVELTKLAIRHHIIAAE